MLGDLEGGEVYFLAARPELAKALWAFRSAFTMPLMEYPSNTAARKCRPVSLAGEP
jgi:hypothetical protein